MKNIIKNIAIIIIGGIIFQLICSGTEHLLLNHLKIENNFNKIFKENFLYNFRIYIIIYCSLIIINLIYNYLIVKVLNKKLEMIKKGGEKNVKK